MLGHPQSKTTYREECFVSRSVRWDITYFSQYFCICLILMPQILVCAHAHFMIICWCEWVAFSAWISTFWQQSRAISETGWLPSLPQFCSNEGAVLPKQTGSLEMYLDYLLNPGSLSYLPTNGPVVRSNTLQCHSSVKPQSDGQVRSLHVQKVKWRQTLWLCRSGV